MEAAGAVLDFLGDMKVGCRSSGMAKAVWDEAESVRQEPEGEEGGRGLP